MKKSLSFAAAVAAALVCGAAPVVDQPIEGYLGWEGLTPKNYLCGRMLSPSDLRHRAVVYIVADVADINFDKLTSLYLHFASIGAVPTPSSAWDSYEIPRSKICVFSVRNAEKMDVAAFNQKIAAPKNAEATAQNMFARCYRLGKIPFYKGVKPVGIEEPSADKLPYVAVFGGSGTKPLFEKGGFKADDIKAVRDAVSKAVRDLVPSASDWKYPLGIAEPEFYKNAAALIEKGKPSTAVFPILLGGMKSKSPEQAKEAQIMYDALNQYRGELVVRMQLEAGSSPARAYFDFQRLVSLFPSEKKNVDAIAQKLKGNKEVSSLGKIFEKVMLWSRPDYVCKNNSEVKKNVAELEKFKKMIETLAESKNVNVQGEALLLQGQIDALIETMPMKLPQK